jgi:hypothetical protein
MGSRRFNWIVYSTDAIAGTCSPPTQPRPAPGRVAGFIVPGESAARQITEPRFHSRQPLGGVQSRFGRRQQAVGATTLTRVAGVLGLVGYLVLAVGCLVMLSVEVMAAVVLPALTQTAPGYVDDVVVAAAVGSPASDIGGMQTVLSVAGIGYMAGGLGFGIALFRTRVLAQWAAALLAVGTVGTVALAVLAESFNRPFAVPTGVALIGLGIFLWHDQRRRPDSATAATSPVRTHAAR